MLSYNFYPMVEYTNQTTGYQEVLCVAVDEFNDKYCDDYAVTLSEASRVDMGFTELEDRIYQSTIGCRECKDHMADVVPVLTYDSANGISLMTCG